MLLTEIDTDWLSHFLQYLQRHHRNHHGQYIPITAIIILYNITIYPQSTQHTLQMYWYLKAPFPPWVSSPWPITMTMGTSSMDTVSRQPATSAAETAVSCQHYIGAVERQREIASCSRVQVCALKREYQWIYRILDLKALNSTFNLGGTSLSQLSSNCQFSGGKDSNHTPKVNNLSLGKNQQNWCFESEKSHEFSHPRSSK